MAARNSDALRSLDFSAMRRGEFGKAVSPPLCRTVRRRSVDDLDLRIFAKGDRFYSRRIRQTQKNDIGRIDALFPRRRIFSLLIGQGKQLDIRPLPEAVIDLQPGRALFSVKKSFGTGPFPATRGRR